MVISVGDVKFYLHKFALLSKSSRLQKLMTDNENAEIHIHDISGSSGILVSLTSLHEFVAAENLPPEKIKVTLQTKMKAILKIKGVLKLTKAIRQAKLKRFKKETME